MATGRTISQAVYLSFSHRLDPRPVRVGSVTGRVAMGHICSQHFDFSLSGSFHLCSLRIHLSLLLYDISNYGRHCITHLKGSAQLIGQHSSFYSEGNRVQTLNASLGALYGPLILHVMSATVNRRP